MSTAVGRIFALVVGIDRFAAHPHLDGCVNDAHAMRDLLVDGFRAPAENVRLLTDEAATRDGIIDAFRSHLIENDAIRPGDAIVFHFSGHGANMLDPLDASPTGLIESLVAHDSGTEGVFGIPDTTVAALLALLAAKRGDNITVVLDCCHSGSGTRHAAGQAPKVRLTRPDERVPPKGLDAAIVGAAKALGETTAVPYTLLAACRDRELAQEYVDASGGKPRSQGAFTWYLVEALWRLAPGTSYAMLHESVAAQVSAYNPRQMPQCEGARDREVFGAAQVRRDPFVRVVAVERGELVLDGGALHGIGRDARLWLYPASVQTADALPAPVAEAVVISVTPSRCRAVVVGVEPEALLRARAVVAEGGEVVAPRRVGSSVAAGASAEARAAVAAVERWMGGSRWVAAAGEGPAELVVRAEGDRVVVCGADDGAPLVMPWGVGDPESTGRAVVGALETIARFRRLGALANPDPGSRLQGRLRVRLRRFVEGAAPQEMPVIEPVDGEVVAVYDPAQETNWHLVEVVNEGSRPVFVSVFSLNEDYSVVQFYPRLGGEQSIDAGRSLFAGHTAAAERLDMWLPGDGPGEPLWTVSRSRILVVATVAPVDLSVFEQGGLDVPVPAGHRSTGLAALIDAAVSGHRMARSRDRAGEDWATASLPYTTVRKPVAVAVGAGVTALGEGLVVEAPAGFSGAVAVESVGQATRGGGARLPPGLVGDGSLSPAGRPGTRGGAEDGLVVSLSVDEAARARVDAAHPLRVTVPGGGELWPVVFDGEDFFVAGHPAGEGRAAITALPAPVGPDGPASRGQITRTLKLFFFKKQGQADESLGLHAAVMVDGVPVYSDVQPTDVPAGGRALLVVHGFASGTKGQVKVLDAALAGYDRILAFDYESLGTPVEENAKVLADALGKAGFGAEDERTLHVVAHSMGGLVARAMIELFGGDAFVDKLVMAGTPNGGTRLYDAVNGALALANFALNKAFGLTTGVPIGFLLDRIKKAVKGPEDLKSGSAFLTRLNTARGGKVPYLVLAGTGGVEEDADAGRFKRLTYKAMGVGLDLLFGEKHDLVVGASHIRSVQGGRYPALAAKDVACNHFDYLTDRSAMAEMAAWLGVELRDVG